MNGLGGIALAFLLMGCSGLPRENGKKSELEPVFVEQDELKYVGMSRTVEDFLAADIDKLRKQFGVRRSEIQSQRNKSGPLVGLYGERGEDGKFKYIAALEVSKDAKIPQGMEVITVPAGGYAEFTHKGPIRDVPKTLNYIYNKWLKESGYVRTDGPDIQIYKRTDHLNSKNFEMKILIPIKM